MKEWLKITLWSIFGVLVVSLLFISQSHERKAITQLPKLNIHEHPGMSFLTEKELITKLKKAQLWNKNMIVDSLKINKIETYISQLNVVDSVNVYSKLGGKWEIDIQIRRPIVRVLPSTNSGFYLDEKGEAMQLSDFPAHVLIVTGLEDLKRQNISYQNIINNDIAIKTRDLYSSLALATKK